MKRKKAEVWDIKNLNMSSRFNQYENRMSEIDDKVDVVHHKFSDALKMTW